MLRTLADFARSERGTTAIEYGLVATFIALAVLTTIQLLGATVLTELYEQIVAAWGA
ncbi:MAG: Flp family type IVb pilin [Alphaproteobacteria bacterium]|nr:Flp family type IVb pilin [Alphaproteobacteria bacterium]